MRVEKLTTMSKQVGNSGKIKDQESQAAKESTTPIMVLILVIVMSAGASLSVNFNHIVSYE